MRTSESVSKHAALRSYVEVSRNLESNAQSLAPPLYQVADTHMPLLAIDKFGHDVPT